jgi:hypothetical protein
MSDRILSTPFGKTCGGNQEIFPGENNGLATVNESRKFGCSYQ